jgi:hypothetical protein
MVSRYCYYRQAKGKSLICYSNSDKSSSSSSNVVRVAAYRRAEPWFVIQYGGLLASRISTAPYFLEIRFRITNTV